MGKSAIARAEARFKQLCCLGLGGEAVMPALLDELRVLIPSVTSTFFFADEAGQLAHIYDDSPGSPAMIQVYMDEFHGRPDRLLPGFDFAESMRTQFGVLDVESAHRIDLGTFRRSEFFNVFYRHNGWDSFMRVIIREPGKALGLGRLTLHRAPGERPFSPDEKRRVAFLVPFMAQALARRSDSEPPLTPSDRTGIIIADTNGKLVHSSVVGLRLLFYAMHPHLPSNVGSGGKLPTQLARLCIDLHRIFRDDPSAQAPALHFRNMWGGFTFRAHWLEGDENGGDLVCLTITHEEPLPVALTRRVGELPLSRRQAEVCLHLANGESNETIAERLGVSRHTVIAHRRWIYDKLDVHNRTELVNKLLTG